MMCRPCLEGNHEGCEKGQCECHLIDEQIGREIALERCRDTALAETVYFNLLYGGSKVAAMFTENAGRPAATVFVQQVLRSYKALRC